MTPLFAALQAMSESQRQVLQEAIGSYVEQYESLEYVYNPADIKPEDAQRLATARELQADLDQDDDNRPPAGNEPDPLSPCKGCPCGCESGRAPTQEEVDQAVRAVQVQEDQAPAIGLDALPESLAEDCCGGGDGCDCKIYDEGE